ncbi:MAG: 16S rRNA (cytosine(1402)-N(4))-methyltransferase RsmH [Candidatus Nomurabacteria bacterium]|jgi:16S rRNA (cytosine1402-N4)-methyltransferase|nr:16S rRNA (cytosine(1402)-N(4))-methyltransferase RsmH [Candidatus Nomurabacteria bacterium]
MEQLHQPVMLAEVLNVLQPKDGESLLDLTAGFGGHARAILQATKAYKKSVLVDRDQMALDSLNDIKAQGATLMHADFLAAARELAQTKRRFDLILADLGVSSPQLDRGERGFSFMREGDLDMRMDQTQTLTAKTVVNTYSERDLANIFVKYGEVRSGMAIKIAREITHARPFSTTQELADLIKKHSPYSRHHPATQFFQALRIEVNDELGLLERMLPLLPDLLNPGGRLCIISFHSLEDRIVKTWLTDEANKGLESKLITNKKFLTAGVQELANNPRARSAKIRFAARA